MRNIDSVERILRVALGLVVLGLGLYGAKVELYTLSGILMGSAAIGFCPLYKLLGYSSFQGQTQHKPRRLSAQHLNQAA